MRLLAPKPEFARPGVVHTLFGKAVKQAQVQDVQAEREARRFAIFTRVAEVEAAPDPAMCAGSVAWNQLE
jgi:hypothetical protein